MDDITRKRGGWPSAPQHDEVVAAQLERLTGRPQPLPDRPRHKLRWLRIAFVVLLGGAMGIAAVKAAAYLIDRALG